jgi:hypothetical protein
MTSFDRHSNAPIHGRDRLLGLARGAFARRVLLAS